MRIELNYNYFTIGVYYVETSALRVHIEKKRRTLRRILRHTRLHVDERHACSLHVEFQRTLINNLRVLAISAY